MPKTLPYFHRTPAGPAVDIFYDTAKGETEHTLAFRRIGKGEYDSDSAEAVYDAAVTLQDKLNAVLAEREAARKHVELLDKTVDALRDALVAPLAGGKATDPKAALGEMDRLRSESARRGETIGELKTKLMRANTLRGLLRDALGLIGAANDDDLVRRANELQAFRDKVVALVEDAE